MNRFATYLLIAVLSLPLVGQGQVLCIGADGHVAVESAFNGKCYEGSRPDRFGDALVVFGSITDRDDCGACADILIGSDVKTDRSARLVSSSVSLVVPALATLDDAPGIPTTPASRPPRQKGYANNPISHLRTVTLLV